MANKSDMLEVKKHFKICTGDRKKLFCDPVNWKTIAGWLVDFRGKQGWNHNGKKLLLMVIASKRLTRVCCSFLAAEAVTLAMGVDSLEWLKWHHEVASTRRCEEGIYTVHDMDGWGAVRKVSTFHPSCIWSQRKKWEELLLEAKASWNRKSCVGLDFCLFWILPVHHQAWPRDFHADPWHDFCLHISWTSRRAITISWTSEQKHKIWFTIMSKWEIKINQKISRPRRNLFSYHKWNIFPKQKMILEFGQT